jgi:hypothetical protein
MPMVERMVPKALLGQSCHLVRAGDTCDRLDPS